MKYWGEIKGNEQLILRLLKKRIRDTKLKTRIRVSLFGIVTLSCLIIGLWSYHDAKSAVISNSRTMLINLMKQAGLNLDERVSAFRSTTYQLLQSDEIEKIIHYTKKEAVVNNADAVSKFNEKILQQDYLYDYIDYGFLYPKNEHITHYYRGRKRMLETSQELEIIKQLEDKVKISRPYNWVMLGDDLYFVRLITDGEGSNDGILALCMNDAFLSFVGTSSNILNNDNIVVVNARQEVLRNNMDGLEEEQLKAILNYDDASYYVYTEDMKINQKEYLMVSLNTADNDWNIIGFISNDTLLKTVRHIFAAMLVVVSGVSILVLIITSLLSKRMTENIRVIEEGMSQYTKGNFSLRLKPVSYDEIGLLALQFNYMGMKIDDLMKRIEREKEQKREAEYQTLQAKINPHFLYNTFGSLKWSCYRKGELETAKIVDAIVNLLRFTIKKADQMVTAQEEINYIKNYVRIEKMRSGNAFKVEYEVDEEIKEKLLPGFVLQPFVENSLIHGLDITKEDSCIIVREKKPESPEWELALEIEDNGIGMDEEKIRSIQEAPPTPKKNSGFTSIGISIVHARLKSYYGNQYQLNIISAPGEGTKITILLGKQIPTMEESHEL